MDCKAPVNQHNNDGETAVAQTTRNGNLDIVRLLLDRGASIGLANNEGDTLLHVAAMDSHYFDVVKELLDHGAHINQQNSNDRTVLSLATRNGNFDIVRLLLDQGEIIDLADNDGDTPMHMVVKNSEFVDDVKELLVRGARIDQQNMDGWTALMTAIHSGCADIALLLIEGGAVIDLPNCNGDTALLVAANNSDCTEVVRELLA